MKNVHILRNVFFRIPSADCQFHVSTESTETLNSLEECIIHTKMHTHMHTYTAAIREKKPTLIFFFHLRLKAFTLCTICLAINLNFIYLCLMFLNEL